VSYGLIILFKSTIDTHMIQNGFFIFLTTSQLSYTKKRHRHK